MHGLGTKHRRVGLLPEKIVSMPKMNGFPKAKCLYSDQVDSETILLLGKLQPRDLEQSSALLVGRFWTGKARLFGVTFGDLR